MSKKFDYDLIVIGGGSGGYAAAKKASSRGLNVAVIEGAVELGGLCILRGCMPTKALLETSNRMRAIQEADEFGIQVGAPVVDLAELRERKSRLIAGFQHYREKGLKRGDFDLIREQARFLDPHTVQAGDRTLRAQYFVIATGSVEKLPPVQGLEGTPYWTSDEVVELPEVPERVIVLGTGAIGMESAFLFQGLGSQVTVISRSRPLVRDVEPEVSEALEKRCEDLGIRIQFGNGVKAVSHAGSTFSVELDDGDLLEAEQLIVATGRVPNLTGLDLEKAGFPVGLGRIEIDQHARSAVRHIFAAGDCASPVLVVHLAVLQGEVAGSNIADLQEGQSELSGSWDERLGMVGIFTDPELVQLGFTEAQAREQGREVEAATYRFDDQGKGEIVGEKHGLVKLVIDGTSREILGAAAFGPHVIDYAHTIMVALHQRLTLEEFLKIPSYHPTLGEIWTYVAEEFLD